MPIDLSPLVLPFAGVEPAFGGALRHGGRRSAVLGRVTAGAGLALGPRATVRADGETVTIGDRFCLGAGATVHIAHGLYATTIGDDVAVGRDAVVHACTVGDGCVIEDEVVILDASEVGAGVLIEAGATVYPRSRLDAGGRYAGSPAVRVGDAAPDDLAARAAAIRAAAERDVDGDAGATDAGAPPPPDAHFVAATAVLLGPAALAPGVGLFFGCRFRTGGLTVGENTNIQDNCAVDADGEVVIGSDTTLGHNVRAGRCRIGSRSLVGIGAVLGPDTVVEDDVLVAAGAVTAPGQVLESGWLWGSRPAKPLKRLDAARRAMMADTIAHYVSYGHSFRDAQRRSDGSGEGSGTRGG